MINITPDFYLRPEPLILESVDCFEPLSISQIVENLKTRTYKSGYHALDRSNPRWASIRDHALFYAFQRISNSALASMVTERGLERPSIFLDNIKTVPKDYQGELALDEMPTDEIAKFIVLYNKILKGESQFTFDADATIEFKGLILANIQMLMTRPSGRLILLSAINARLPILFRSSSVGSSEYVDLDDNRIIIQVSEEDAFLAFFTISQNQELRTFQSALWLVIGHELIHALADSSVLSKLWRLQNSNLFEEMNYYGLRVSSRDPAYSSLSETLAIEGVEGLPSENMLNYEFGYPPRYGHLGYRAEDDLPALLASLPALGIGFNPKMISELLLSSLTTDHIDNFALIFPFLTSDQILLTFHHALPNKCPLILRFLEANLHKIDEQKFIEILSLAACKDIYTNVLDVLLTRYPDYVNRINPNTGCAPLHVAAFSNCLRNVRLLIETKNANPTLINSLNMTPLTYALSATKNTTKIVSYLVERDLASAFSFFRSYRGLPGHTKTFWLVQEVKTRFNIPLRSSMPVRTP